MADGFESDLRAWLDAQPEGTIDPAKYVEAATRIGARYGIEDTPDNREFYRDFAAREFSSPGPSVWNVARADPVVRSAAPSFSTTQTVPLKEGYQQENLDLFASLPRGSTDPEAYAAAREALDRKYGYAVTPELHKSLVDWATKYYNDRSQGINLTVPEPTAPLTGADYARNQIVADPMGAAVASYANARGFGGTEMLLDLGARYGFNAPGQLDAMYETHPYSTMGGEGLGMVSAANRVGRLGTDLVERYAPSLLRTDKAVDAARMVGGDMAYGAARGAITSPDDPLTGAAYGMAEFGLPTLGLSAAGSALGRLAPRGFGADVAEDVVEAATPQPSRPLALPAPPKVLALPPPKPKSLAAKPRGGQFFPDAPLAARDAQAAGYKIENYTGRYGTDRYGVLRPDGSTIHFIDEGSPQRARAAADAFYTRGRINYSPEGAARRAREDVFPGEGGATGWAGPNPLGDWLEKALAKYYKTDFGTEADPLRDLAARGLHYELDMTPERWLEEANSSLMEDPIGYYTVPRHADEIAAENAPITSGGMQGDEGPLAQQIAPGLSYFGSADPIGQGALMQAAPWLRKQPVTDMLYGIKEPLDLGHFTDELLNAMSGQLPPDLAVRPEMLERMSFAQAAERVGRINQFRAKEMERAALAAQDNPVTQMFKEYPEGMRWVEMAPPKNDGPANYDVEEELRKALKFEGDTMGHCVGGYCPDVMSGSTRIFSLRDAKGMPHVTIETSPADRRGAALAHFRALGVYPEWRAYLRENPLMGRDAHTVTSEFLQARGLPPVDYSAQDIVQIKGKQNRKPNAEYLPFVQDFVKSGQWGDVGDLANTDLVRLPDRFISSEDFNRVVEGDRLDDMYQSYDFNARGFPRDPSRMDPEAWEQFGHYFDGYARGGLAVKKRGCMQCGGFAVRKTA